MDAILNSSCEDVEMQVLQSNGSKPTKFRNDSHAFQLVEALQSLHKDDILCDIKLKTDDGTIVLGHKNVLISVSPYFRAIFSSEESNKDVVSIKDIDSTILQLLVDYIYTGEISITKENVQVLLPAACILQLDYVSIMCEDFMKTQLDPSNCLSTKAFANLHYCIELFSSSEAYIKKHFVEVTESDEFLALSLEEVINLISCDDITVPFEEKVFECVINWVKHELDSRKDFLPKLMEHVRLPLVPLQNILKRYYEETILNNNSQCKDYMIEALHLHSLNKEQLITATIPYTIRNTPRQSGGSQKVILMFNRSNTLQKCYTELYDPVTKIRKKAPGMNDSRKSAGLGIIRDQFVFAVGGVNGKSSQSSNMLDLYSKSPCWLPMVNMLVKRKFLGVGVLNDCLYAVGGDDGTITLNSVEVFDFKKWRMVSSMSTKRNKFGIGVLNNCLYVVGGWDGSNHLKSVECYDPTLNTWAPVMDMSVCRNGVGVGVVNGIIYVFGGHDGDSYLKSAEAFRQSDGVWFTIADMHVPRFLPGVVTINGLLYVIGGSHVCNTLDSFEIYNPNTNTWSMESLSRDNILIYGGVVVDRPLHF